MIYWSKSHHPVDISLDIFFWKTSLWNKSKLTSQDRTLFINCNIKSFLCKNCSTT